MTFPQTIFLAALFLAGVLVSGCKDKDAVKVYRISKAEPEAPAPADSGPSRQAPADAVHANLGTGGAGAPMPASGGPSQPALITQTPPPNWERQPLSSMRQASYLVKGDNGAAADISLVILAGPAGGIPDNVNRWLSQLGQPEITSDQIGKIAQHVQSAIGDVTVVDLEGKPQGGDAAKDGRIIAGIATGPQGSFFFKMRGNAVLAEAQKAAFIQWIGTARWADVATAPSPADPAPGGGASSAAPVALPGTASDPEKPATKQGIPLGCPASSSPASVGPAEKMPGL